MRIRKIAKWGNTYVIKLKPFDMTDLGLEENGFVDIDDITKIHKKGAKLK